LFNEKQLEIHFKTDEPLVVQDVALVGDKTASLNVEMAYPHMKVSQEYQPFLGFEHHGVCYVYVAMPFDARHSRRVFMRALGYAMACIRVHWEMRITAFIDDVLLLHQEVDYLELAT
jgi:hypothetical protein